MFLGFCWKISWQCSQMHVFLHSFSTLGHLLPSSCCFLFCTYMVGVSGAFYSCLKHFCHWVLQELFWFACLTQTYLLIFNMFTSEPFWTWWRPPGKTKQIPGRVRRQRIYCRGRPVTINFLGCSSYMLIHSKFTYLHVGQGSFVMSLKSWSGKDADLDMLDVKEVVSQCAGIVYFCFLTLVCRGCRKQLPGIGKWEAYHFKQVNKDQPGDDELGGKSLAPTHK